jgi:biotin carboxylase
MHIQEINMSEKSRPVAVVLGGTSAHSVLLQKLRVRGYRSILVDYLENPPAAPLADEHARVSTLDPEAVREVAEANKAVLVIATCVDQANVVAIGVSEALGLPRPYSHQTASDIANKARMKRLVENAGIATARHVHLNDAASLPPQNLRFPLVVKPADSNGSAGVRRADTPEEFSDYLARALKISRVGQAVVEEFVEGPELSIDCFIEKGRAKIVLVRRKYNMRNAGEGAVIQSTGSIAPWPLGELHDVIEEQITRLAASTGLDNVPLLVQAFMTPNGISIIEFAARLSGGTGAATTLRASGFDAVEASIDSWLGVPVKVQLCPSGLYSMTNTIYAAPGILGRVDGVDELISDGTMSEMLTYRMPGAEIGADMSTRSRVGAFLVTGPDISTVMSRMRRAIERLEVYDANDRPIMRRDVFGQLAESN